METLNLDLNKQYTFADYLTWFNDVRRELYNGFINIIVTSPTLSHQRASGNLSRLLVILQLLKNEKFICFSTSFQK